MNRKADRHQQPPARIEQYAFGRKNEKESEDETARYVDQQRAIGKRGGKSRRSAC